MFDQRHDRVVEEVLDVVGGDAVQDPGQVALGDLQFTRERLGGQSPALGAGLVDQPGAAHPGVVFAYCRENVEFVQDVQGGATEVDGVAATAHDGSAFDDGDPVAVAAQQVGEGGSGDTRTRDQNLRFGHGEDANSD